jgi:RNA polymerase sigma-70 factor (ECF subfamily)
MGDVVAQEAIERVYREYATQLWRGVYAFSGGRRDIADDAVAEAFARAIEHAERIRAPLPWLYRVALREAAARLSKEKRDVDLQAVDYVDANERVPNEALALLRTLSSKQRAIIFLFYYADFSIADIARATGSSQVAVRVQMYRAREALRQSYRSATALREEMSPGGST